MTARQVPDGATPGRTTPSFTALTVPSALRKAHHTTVWAELVVECGTVVFVEEDPPWKNRVEAPGTQAIVPNRKHHVDPEPGAVFHVQFYEPASS